MNALRKSIAIVFLSANLLMLSGCLEFEGPAWSPDGQRIAFTQYTRAPESAQKAQPGPALLTSVYIVNPDDDPPAPNLVASAAAFPHWAPDGTLYYLGERNDQGLYSKIFKFNPADAKSEVALAGLRATGMQLAFDHGPAALILSGQGGQTGSAVRAEVWNAESGKRQDLGSLGQIYGPALSYNGHLLLYATRPAEGHAVLMLTELNGGNLKESTPVFPTKEFSEPGASNFIVHAFPDSERFMFYGTGSTGIYTTNGKVGAWKFTKIIPPVGLSTPVMASISADSKSAAFTFARITLGKISYESYEFDFARAVWAKQESDSPVLIGGQVQDPKAKKNGATRKAWLSQAGLTLGDAAQPKLMPITASQLVAASAQALKSGDAAKALEHALKAQEAKPAHDDPEAVYLALFRAYLASKTYDRACETYEQGTLLYPLGGNGLRMIYPATTGLPSAPSDWISADLRRMDDLIAGAPGNRMIPALKEAFAARQKGEHSKAIDFYQRAFDLCPDKARTGGVKFLQGICELEMGNLYPAAEYFDSAARNEDFPQADYAAGMAVLCFLLNGKAESAAKANAVLQLPSVRKSPMANEIGQIGTLIKNKPQRVHDLTKESVSADGSAHVWAEFDTYQLPVASLKPVGVEGRDGKFVQRHFGVKTVTASSIWSNKSNQPVLRLAHAVTQPQLSPTANLMAFTVSGDVFPQPDNYCELFIMDLKGTVYTGNAAVAAAGRVRGRKIISKFYWEGDGAVKIEGVDVDVFGGQKPMEKSVAVGRGNAAN